MEDRQARRPLPDLCGFALTALLVLAVLALARRYRELPCCCNSDDLYCVEVVQDLLGRGYERHGWHLPYAPQIFPDAPLLLPCVLLFKDVLRIFTTYSCLYFGLMVVVLTALFRQAGLGGRAAFRLAGCGVLALLAALLDPACEGWVRWSFVPAAHAGAILAGLALWLLVVRSLDRRASWKTAALFVALGGLTVFSDRLVVAQFLGPLCLAVLALAALRVLPWRKAAEVMVLTGAAYGVAVGLQFAFSWCSVVLLPLSRIVDVTKAPEALKQFLADLPTYVRGQGVVIAVFLALLPVGLAAGLYRGGRVRAGAGRRECTAAVLCLAAVLGCVCNVGAAIVTGVARIPDTPRYFLAALFLPFLFLGLGLRCLPGRAGRLLSRGLALAAIVYAGSALALRPGGLTPDLGDLSQPYPEPAATLDRLAREGKIARGLASYWSARKTQYLSRAGVQLRTVHPDGQPWLHLQNPNAFLAPDRHCLEVPRYNYLLVDPEQDTLALNREEILRRYGSPREKVRAGCYEVWLYDGLIAQTFTLFLRSTLAQRCREQLPAVGPERPACLARPERNFAGGRSSRRVELTPEGEVTVAFAGPVRGSLLDLGGAFDGHYEITFRRGEEAVGRAYAPRAGFPNVSACYGSPGNQGRLVTIPPGAARRGWTAATVRGAGGPGQFALSHFLVYDRTRRPPSARQMSPGGRWRFESELQPGDSVVSADPQAGGGLARSAPGDFSGLVVRGPFLFLEPSRYRVEFHIKADAACKTGVLGEAQVTSECGKHVHVRRPLPAAEFAGCDGYRKVSLTLETDIDLSDCEFRVLADGKGALYVDRVELVCER